LDFAETAGSAQELILFLINTRFRATPHIGILINTALQRGDIAGNIFGNRFSGLPRFQKLLKQF
jgi:hypothetical protein